MQTFKGDYVLTGIPSAEIYQQLIDYAKSKGVPVYEETSKETYNSWPNLVFSINNQIAGNCAGIPDYKITFEQFFQYCDNWKKNQPVRIKLNESYTAEITGNTVKVGCQTFEFAAIEELYNAMKNTP